MISYPKDRAVTTDTNIRGGEGPVRLTTLFDEKLPHLRLFKEIAMDPGSSIGAHDHQAELEIYYVLEGEATVLDNGEYITLQPGDAHLCRDGEEHALYNKSGSPLRILAIIPTLAE